MTPDRWLALSVRSPDDPRREYLAGLLVELGGRAVVEEDGWLTTHLLPPEDVEAFQRAASDLVRSGADGLDVEFRWGWQKQEDWAEYWKQGLEARQVSPRLLVAPTWIDLPPESAGSVLLRIDPGMAFGTAEHATTRGCLRLLDEVVREGERVLDIGAGSAILSIAAALLGATRVSAVEADPVACPAAQENIERNQVSDRVRVIQTQATSDAIRAWGPCDGIMANIETAVLLPLFPGFRAALEPGGWLILSGITEEEAPAVRRAAADHGFEPIKGDLEDRWWSGLFQVTPVSARSS